MSHHAVPSIQNIADGFDEVVDIRHEDVPMILGVTLDQNRAPQAQGSCRPLGAKIQSRAVGDHGVDLDHRGVAESKENVLKTTAVGSNDYPHVRVQYNRFLQRLIPEKLNRGSSRFRNLP